MRATMPAGAIVTAGVRTGAVIARAATRTGATHAGATPTAIICAPALGAQGTALRPPVATTRTGFP